MKTIWKYVIPPADEFAHDIPKGAQFLSLGVQRNDVQMWWLVDDSAPKEERSFAVVGTGHAVPCVDRTHEPARYLGTFQVHGGNLVFHLFEVAP